MSAPFATMNDHIVTFADVTIPRGGAVSATVRLALPIALTGRVSLVVGDMTIVGTVARGGVAVGDAEYLVIGGANGWHRAVKEKGYRNDAGVKLSTVVQDAAALVGETVEVAEDRRLGAAWTRLDDSASDVLYATSPGWHVGLDGVTRLAPRKGADVSASYDVTAYHPAARTVELGCETPGAILPGDRLVRGLPAPMRIGSVWLRYGSTLRLTVEGLPS